MNEIKINDFIRTNDGRIAKVVNIKEQNKIYKYRVKFRDRTRYISAEDIKDNKPNIKKLFQVGDIVEILLDKETNKTTLFCFESQKQIDMLNNKDCRQITGIVTKEQIKKIMYRVEE